MTWGDVCIRDISTRGLMAQAAQPPDTGTYIEIRRGLHCVVGRVVWCNARNFGIRSQDRIDIDGIVSERPAAANDAPAQADRRTGPARAPASAAERTEASRRFAGGFQFLAVIALGLAGAGFAAWQVHDLLSRPMAMIGGALGGEPSGK